MQSTHSHTRVAHLWMRQSRERRESGEERERERESRWRRQFSRPREKQWTVLVASVSVLGRGHRSGIFTIVSNKVLKRSFSQQPKKIYKKAFQVRDTNLQPKVRLCKVTHYSHSNRAIRSKTLLSVSVIMSRLLA